MTRARICIMALLATVLVSCASLPSPTPTTPAPTLRQGEGTRPAPTPSPFEGAPINGLITYPGSLVSFEYPAGWHMITGGFNARHYEWIEAVLGTGNWEFNCTQSITATGDVYAATCGADIFIADPGQVVVELHDQGSPASSPPTPPPASTSRPDGLSVAVEHSGFHWRWTLYGLPESQPPLLVDVEFGGEPSPAAIGEVAALVASILLASAAP